MICLHVEGIDGQRTSAQEEALDPPVTSAHDVPPVGTFHEPPAADHGLPPVAALQAPPETAHGTPPVASIGCAPPTMRLELPPVAGVAPAAVVSNASGVVRPPHAPSSQESPSIIRTRYAPRADIVAVVYAVARGSPVTGQFRVWNPHKPRAFFPRFRRVLDSSAARHRRTWRSRRTHRRNTSES